MTLRIIQDLRAFLGPVRDQGRRPTCLSFAASAAHEHARDNLRPLSVEWLYFHAAQRAGTGPQEGTTLPDARCVLHEVGQPEEFVWPYRNQMPERGSWSPPARVSSLFRCASNECQADMGLIRAQLDYGSPVVLALFVSSAFTARSSWVRDGDEIILPEDDEPIDRSRGHAVVAVGHGRFGDEPIILIRNSWGTGWCHEGHAWVRESYLERRLFGGFTICEREGDVLQSDAGGQYARTRVG